MWVLQKKQSIYSFAENFSWIDLHPALKRNTKGHYCMTRKVIKAENFAFHDQCCNPPILLNIYDQKSICPLFCVAEMGIQKN